MMKYDSRTAHTGVASIFGADSSKGLSKPGTSQIYGSQRDLKLITGRETRVSTAKTRLAHRPSLGSQPAAKPSKYLASEAGTDTGEVTNYSRELRQHSELANQFVQEAIRAQSASQLARMQAGCQFGEPQDTDRALDHNYQ